MIFKYITQGYRQGYRSQFFLLLALFMSALVMSTPVLAKDSGLVRLQRLIDEHTVAVQGKVLASWILPSVTLARLSSVIEVKVATDGKVLATRLIRSSGEPDFDRSAEVAVTRSSPLPVAADPEVMDQFHTFQFEFRYGSFKTVKSVPVNPDTLGYANYPHVKSPVYIDK